MSKYDDIINICNNFFNIIKIAQTILDFSSEINLSKLTNYAITILTDIAEQ